MPDHAALDHDHRAARLAAVEASGRVRTDVLPILMGALGRLGRLEHRFDFGGPPLSGLCKYRRGAKVQFERTDAPAMAVLHDRGILEAIEANRVRIAGFNPKNLTPNGYDLAIAEVAVVSGTTETFRVGTAKIPPLTRFAVSTVEVVELGEDITAQLWLRTTWARRGVLASFGKVDAGFRGTLTLPAFNANSSGTLEIPIGERFAQIVFEDLARPAEKRYGERSGQWQDQRGVRLK